MSYVMTSKEFVKISKEIATKHKTAYMLGTFGWPATSSSITRAINSNSTNAARPSWQTRAKAVINKGYLFDCSGLIKAILWGWNADKNKNYGGAKYASNGVPDIGSDVMIKQCPGGGSSDFKTIVPGECVWMKGHIGIYIGDGLVVEATPSWTGGVQISVCTNVVSSKDGYTNKRRWTKHGKLPWVDYSVGNDTGKKDNKDIINAIKKINKAGVDLTEEYWVENFDKLEYLDALIISVGNKIVNKDSVNNDPVAAIDKLAKLGVINDAAYWKKNYTKVEYLGEFFCKLAKCEFK